MSGGSGPEQRLSLVTLGVSDLEVSTRFYQDVLGWERSPVGGDQVTFFQLNGLILGLFPRDELAADAGVELEAGAGFSRVSLAHNVREREDVDRVLAHVAAGGARVVRPARDTEWGGRSGYFADPDGLLWEVAWNPHFPLGEDGSVRLPG